MLGRIWSSAASSKIPAAALRPSAAISAGRRRACSRCAFRLSRPGPGPGGRCQSGPACRLSTRGCFLAPTVVSGALKGAIFAANIYERLGYPVIPNAIGVPPRYHPGRDAGLPGGHAGLLPGHPGRRTGGQLCRPLCPGPCRAMTSEVIMAAGAFVQGSSIELSRRRADPPALRRLFPGRPDLVSRQDWAS